MWKMLFRSSPGLMFMGKSGLLGEQAKKDADEVWQELAMVGVVFLILIIIAAIAFLVWRFVTSVGLI